MAKRKSKPTDGFRDIVTSLTPGQEAALERPCAEFMNRMVGDGVTVQLCRNGARVLHSKAVKGGIILDNSVPTRTTMTPRRLGSAYPDTEGKGDARMMNHPLRL